MSALGSTCCVPDSLCVSVTAGDFQSQVKVFSRITQIPVSTGAFPWESREKAHTRAVPTGDGRLGFLGFTARPPGLGSRGRCLSEPRRKGAGSTPKAHVGPEHLGGAGSAGLSGRQRVLDARWAWHPSCLLPTLLRCGCGGACPLHSTWWPGPASSHLLPVGSVLQSCRAWVRQAAVTPGTRHIQQIPS